MARNGLIDDNNVNFYELIVMVCVLSDTRGRDNMAEKVDANQ